MGSRPKQPLDVLQGMINGVLIEVGRALRPADKQGGRTLANASTRLRSSFPGAIDNFHQALDDLEYDIVRAKEVFLRDLDELRAKRLALENPPVQAAGDTSVQESMIVEDHQETVKVENNEPTPQPPIKEGEGIPQEAEQQSTEDVKPIETADTPKESVPLHSDLSKGLQGPSPPNSVNDLNIKPDPVDTGIDIISATGDPGLPTSGQPDSSIDALFDFPDSGNNDGTDMDFEGMDFLESRNTQGQNDFDLSTFGTSQDFNLPDLNTSNDTNTNIASTSKQDDLFGMVNTTDGGDLMHLDLDLNTAGGDDSIFDDMFFTGADDTNVGGGGEMEHGVYDDAFFGQS